MAQSACLRKTTTKLNMFLTIRGESGMSSLDPTTQILAMRITLNLTIRRRHSERYLRVYLHQTSCPRLILFSKEWSFIIRFAQMCKLKKSYLLKAVKLKA